MKKVLLTISWVLFVLPFLKAQNAASTMGRPSQLRFTENKGQWHEKIKYNARIPNGNILLENNGFYFFLFAPDDVSKIHHPGHKEDVTVHGHAFKEIFEGANPDALLKGEETYADYANYYHGNNPKYWASGAKIHANVHYQDLYPGIDLVIYGRENNLLKYDFVVKAGADISKINIRYEGTDGLTIKDRQLHIQTSLGDIVEEEPIAWQEVGGVKKELACNFVLNEAGQLGFEFPYGYDKSLPLIIDPNIIFSTYTGATSDNWGYTATYGNDGSMYVGGYVNLTFAGQMYPTTVGAFQMVWGGGTGGNGGFGSGIGFACDMGISKFSPDGRLLTYSTYLGGNDNETPNSLVVDAQDNLIIYGVSYSRNYPVSAGAYDATYNEGGDIVVTKFNAAGTALLGSTFIGGSFEDGMNFDPGEFTAGNLKTNYGDQNRGEVNIDEANDIYVASSTFSFNFPVTAGALQNSYGGGTQDGCAFKLNSDCSQLLWSTFLGGSSDDACYSLELAPGGTMYVAGGTMSNNFPTTPGTFHPLYQGGSSDGFVSHINNTGTQLLSSSYIGTSGDDQVYFVKSDAAHNIYFIGQTTGFYPVQNAAYSNPNSGQFISKVNPALTSTFYSTVFGNGNGQPNISPTAFLVDTCENVYVSGWGCRNNSIFATTGAPIFGNDMSNLPITQDALQKTTDGNDFYFFVISKNAQSLLYASYFGGRGDGFSSGIEHVDGGTSRFDKRGVIYEAICAGCGGNSLTPTTPGVWSVNNPSTNCNELGLKIAFNLAGTSVQVNAFPRATGCVPLTVQFVGIFNQVQGVRWYFGDGQSDSTRNPVHTYTDTGTYRVMLVGIDSNSCNIADTAYLNVVVRNDSLSADFTPGVDIKCDSNRVALSTASFSTTKYLWNMGDNTVYTTPSVSHIYATPGQHFITLILSDSTKCNLEDTFTSKVFIPAQVDASFSTNTSKGCVPLVVNFTAPFVSTAKYFWTFGDGDTSTAARPTHTFRTSNLFNVRLIVTDSSSCNKADTADIVIATIDSSADASFRFTRTFFGCDSVRVHLVSDYKGETSELWDMGDGTRFLNNDSVTYTYTTKGDFIITHYLTDSAVVCDMFDSTKIAVSLNPLQASLAIPDTGGCLPFIGNFLATTGLLSSNYLWYFGDGDTATGNPVANTYVRTGTFNVLVIATDTNACVGIDSAFAQITVINDSVIALFQTNILNACDSNLLIDLQNQSINALQYNWDFGDGATSANTNENHAYNTPGSYTITLTATDNNRCHPVDTETITVSLLPNSYVDFTAPDVCLGTAVQFTNLSNPNARFVWDFGNSRNSTLFSPSHLYGRAEVYTVTLTIEDSTTCNFRDTVIHDVEVFQKPIAGFLISSDTFKYDNPVDFTANSIYYTHLLWSFGDGDTLSDETNPTHNYLKIGNMTVCIEASNSACADTMCKDIFISFSKLIGVPNAFSPNGDGVNPVVKVEGKGIVELTFRIYNRWGEKVFETHDKNQGWDGTYKGVIQEMDVYTYTVEAILVNGDIVPLKGNITLLK